MERFLLSYVQFLACNHDCWREMSPTEKEILLTQVIDSVVSAVPFECLEESSIPFLDKQECLAYHLQNSFSESGGPVVLSIHNIKVYVYFSF
jgi:hypothetical protein